MGRNLLAGVRCVLLTQYGQVLLSDRIFEKRGLDTNSNIKNNDSVKESVSRNKILMAYYVQGANRLLALMMGTTGRALRRAGDSNRRRSGTRGDAPLIGATRGTRGKSVRTTTGDRESCFRGRGAGKARGLRP